MLKERRQLISAVGYLNDTSLKLQFRNSQDVNRIYVKTHIATEGGGRGLIRQNDKFNIRLKLQRVSMRRATEKKTFLFKVNANAKFTIELQTTDAAFVTGVHRTNLYRSTRFASVLNIATALALAIILRLRWLNFALNYV